MCPGRPPTQIIPAPKPRADKVPGALTRRQSRLELPGDLMTVPQVRLLRCQLLSLAQQVRRHGRLRREAPKGLEAEKARLKKLFPESLLENNGL